MLPQDIIDNTIRAFSTSARRRPATALRARRQAATWRRRTVRTASRSPPGDGDCGVRSLVVTGPTLFRFDLSASKRVTHQRRYELRVPRGVPERVQHAVVRSGGDGEQQPEQLPRDRRRFGAHDSVRLQGQLLARIAILTGRGTRGFTRVRLQCRRGANSPCGFFLVREPTYNEGFCQGAFASMRAPARSLHEQH